MAIRLKSWFFTISGDSQVGGYFRRFVGGGISKPTQATFEDLTDSVAFKSELTDGASDNGLTTNHSSGSPLQGLVTTAVDADIVNDANIKASYTSNTPIVAKAYQMTAVAEEVQTLDTLNEALVDVTNTGTTRRNYVVKLATSFITWLGLIRTQLTTAQSDITTLDGRVDTAETDIDTLQANIGKTLVSNNDTTSGYLNGKLVVGTGIAFTENNNGANETLTVALDSSYITSGEYNPTISSPTGVSLSQIRAYYHKIGNYVFVQGSCVATIFKDQSVAFTLSVPVATANFTDLADTNGQVSFGNFGSSTVATITGAVSGSDNIGTQTITFLGGQSDLGGSASIADFPVGFNFSYKIIS